MKFTRHSTYAIFLVALMCLGSHVPARAQQSQKSHQDNKETIPTPKDQRTEGSVTVGGKDIDYAAVAGTIPLFNDDRDTTAHIFYTAYFKKDVKDRAQRPVTFFYNGGPGSATVWLHMGSFGPVRVGTQDTAHVSGAPYELLSNQYSLLDATDLVFVDAPGTGFSRLTNNGKDDHFFGVDQDAHAFADFITGFLTKHNRWNSPKYLFGESYGTTRSAVLSNILTTQKSVDLNGIILLSQILDYSNSVDYPQGSPGNERPYELALPTYAATAWYHNKLPNKPAELEPFLKEVEAFAMGDYASALAKGSELSDSRFNMVAEKLHQYTGLSVDYIKKANLRVSGGEFEKNLQVDEMQTTGRLDSRFSGPTMDPLSQRSHYDPQSAAISSAYVTLFNDYVRSTLHFGQHMEYRPSYRKHWDFDHGYGIGMNVMPDLSRAMKYNPRMHILLTGGYFDLATPFYEGIYEMHHLPIEQKLQENISYKYFKSGHMVYVNPDCLGPMHDAVANFIRKTDNVE
ncbi:MAG: hypothetical protein PVH63_00750 [Balneolaceae bacterium]